MSARPTATAVPVEEYLAAEVTNLRAHMWTCRANYVTDGAATAVLIPQSLASARQLGSSRSFSVARDRSTYMLLTGLPRRRLIALSSSPSTCFSHRAATC